MDITKIDGMLVLQFNALFSLFFSIVFLLVGAGITKKVAFLRKFCIPAPVTGGIVFSILHLILYKCGVAQIVLDETMEQFFLLMFFCAIGYSCNFKLVRKAGKLLLVFFGLTIVLTIGQNLLSVLFAKITGIHPVLGLMAGSAALVGGHGNALAFGKIAEEWGHTSAVTFGAAASTYGLVIAVVLGNVIAERLFKMHKLEIVPAEFDASEFQTEKKTHIFNGAAITNSFVILITTVGVGAIFYIVWKSLLPNVSIVAHVWALACGCVVRAFCDKKGKNLPLVEIESLQSTFLAMFVTLALMTMKLWQLVDLAIPLIVILAVNTIFTILFVMFVTYNLCGKNYDAACLASGMFGFGTGSAISSMANLEGLSSKYELSKIAYFIIPIVGAGLSNISNALLTNLFMAIFK